MSRRRLERLVNLTIALMATPRPLTVEEIGRVVEGYEPEAAEAFRRMFERDKEDLREQGVPVETRTVAGGGLGYLVPRRDYALPDIALEPDEAAALGLAARLWSGATLAAAGGSALRKLGATGLDLSPASGGLSGRIEAPDAAFEPALAAVRRRQELRFDYRRPGQQAPSRRRVQPWGLVSWNGHWYLAGQDLDRGESRVFRLSRIDGVPRAHGPEQSFEPPPGIDLRRLVADSGAGGQPRQALVLLAPGRANALRREGRPGPQEDTVLLDYTDPGRLADTLAGYGPDVRALEPAEVVEAVRSRLRAALASGDRMQPGSEQR